MLLLVIFRFVDLIMDISFYIVSLDLILSRLYIFDVRVGIYSNGDYVNKDPWLFVLRLDSFR